MQLQDIINQATGEVKAMLIEYQTEQIKNAIRTLSFTELSAAKAILQALGLRKGLEIIACPTCGRTKINLRALAKEVERRLGNCNAPLKIAVMGCVVNGPGEAREADYGIAGGVDEGLIFRKGEVVVKVPQSQLVGKLMDLLMQDGLLYST